MQIVKSNLPKATVEVTDGGLQKSLMATIKGGFFGKTKTLKINYRQRKNPSYKLDNIECGLTQNLAGMVGFIQGLPAKNEAIKDKFLHKVMATNAEMAFIADPLITEEFEAVLKKICLALDAFLFAPANNFFTKSKAQHFLDKHFNLILDANGNCEVNDLEVTVDAKYHDQPAAEYSQEQITRKSKSEAFLESNGVKLNKNLPCVEDASMVRIRSVKEVVDRAYCLLVIAAKGEGVEQAPLDRMVKEKPITGFSPQETAVYQSSQLSDQERANAAWRYESLNTMLWALGTVGSLKYPSDICDVPAVVEALFKPTREAFEKSVQLRSASEILDELDKTYRMHWACVDARLKGQQAAGNLNPSVVFERHYSLNWLTNFEDQDWDEVETHT